MSKWNRPADILEALAVIAGCLVLATMFALSIGLIIERYL
jgi:hypothetical protein